jgi:hypothetical protein
VPRSLAHSALQVIPSEAEQELLFDKTGITLADPYTAGGEVLMGTLRQEKENAAILKKAGGL